MTEGSRNLKRRLDPGSRGQATGLRGNTLSKCHLYQLLSAIQDPKIWDKKISNSYLKMICSHLKKLMEIEKLRDNRLQDQFYFCILKQRQNIENWEEIECFFNSNLTADYYHVFNLAAWDYSFSSMSYLLANNLINPDARNKFWYSTCYDTYQERQFDGYCMTRYGEDSAQFEQYVTLPALFLVIAVFTRPDMKHNTEELFNVIKLFVSHDAKCTSYSDGLDRGIDLYLRRYAEVKTRFLEQDEKSQFEFEWRRIQQIVSVKRGAAALPIYSIFNQNADETEHQSAALNTPGVTNYL